MILFRRRYQYKNVIPQCLEQCEHRKGKFGYFVSDIPGEINSLMSHEEKHLLKSE